MFDQKSLPQPKNVVKKRHGLVKRLIQMCFKGCSIHTEEQDRPYEVKVQFITQIRRRA